jgi:hypothetical protein
MAARLPSSLDPTTRSAGGDTTPMPMDTQRSRRRTCHSSSDVSLCRMAYPASHPLQYTTQTRRRAALECQPDGARGHLPVQRGGQHGKLDEERRRGPRALIDGQTQPPAPVPKQHHRRASARGQPRGPGCACAAPAWPPERGQEPQGAAAGPGPRQNLLFSGGDRKEIKLRITGRI